MTGEQRISWEERDWVSQDLRIDKIRRDWETGLKQIQRTPAPVHAQPLATPKLAVSTMLQSGRSAVHPLEASRVSTQSEPVAELSLSISGQSLDKALSMT